MAAEAARATPICPRRAVLACTLLTKKKRERRGGDCGRGRIRTGRLLILQRGDVPPVRLEANDATPTADRSQLSERPIDEAIGLATRHETRVAETPSHLRWRGPGLAERPDHRPDDVAREHDRLPASKDRTNLEEDL